MVFNWLIGKRVRVHEKREIQHEISSFTRAIQNDEVTLNFRRKEGENRYIYGSAVGRSKNPGEGGNINVMGKICPRVEIGLTSKIWEGGNPGTPGSDSPVWNIINLR